MKKPGLAALIYVPCTHPKPLFELIHRLLGPVGGLFEESPGPHGQGDMVALAAGQPVLVGLHAGELLEFAVKRLNRPADSAFVLGTARKVARSLSWLFLSIYAFCISPEFINARLFGLSLVSVWHQGRRAKTRTHCANGFNVSTCTILTSCQHLHTIFHAAKLIRSSQFSVYQPDFGD